MDVSDHDSWQDFIQGSESTIKHQTEEGGYPIIFRGQSNASWNIETTLERNTGLLLQIDSYFNIIKGIQPTLETFTKKRWLLPNIEDYLAGIKNLHTYNSPDFDYSYLGYLRHFGFPSPLLDWTYSPYVASYFAFRDITTKAEKVAIYEYMLTYEYYPTEKTNYPQIFPITTPFRDNTRHYLQQSTYTLCIKQIDDKLYFASYEDPDLENFGSTFQITKHTFPANERAYVLKSLDIKNINAYSLFGSEESLLETLFLRKYVSTQTDIKRSPTRDKRSIW